MKESTGVGISPFRVVRAAAIRGTRARSHLLNLALDWLWANGADLVWLTTGPDTAPPASTSAAAGRHRRDRDR